ncbi:ABC transporter ATP-binding protein [Fictibacillus halophilus]|uniref:ABC transporter ATP-binding protein n=1 Tax=Fictibacillus halophilus TaxID=1610490 RepID=UPI001CFBAC20|nr:ABC transporter ATP-binding protein [Fictibacillus halophilus]
MMIKNLYKSLKIVLFYGKSWFLYSIILMVLLGLMPLATIWVTKELVNSVAFLINNGFTSQNSNKAFLLLLLQLTLLVLDSGLGHLQNYNDELMKIRIQQHLINKIVDKATVVPFINYENPDFYNHLNRVKQEPGLYFLSPIKCVFEIFQASITILSLSLFLLSIHWSLLIISLVSVIPTILLKSYFGKKSFLLNQKLIPLLRENGYIESLLTTKESSREIRLFNSKDFFITRWTKRYEEYKKLNLKFLKHKSMADLFLDFITSLTYSAAAGVIIWLIKNKSVKIGEFVSIGQSIHSLQATLSGVSINIAKLYQDAFYLNDYFRFIESKDEESNQETDFPHVIKRGIDFKNVTFAYTKDKNTLNDISFRVRPGEKVAIVGENGSGKTTLINCLLGLYPLSRGDIVFDEKSINDISKIALQKNITVIFQDFIRYFFTIKENIAISNVNEINNIEKIKSVTETTNSRNFIETLPNSFNTHLGRFLQEGVNFSGGQWQKIALSRALFKESQIIVLDEPTSALDPIAEMEVYELFKEVTKNKITFFISHRMSAAKLADRILVMEGGRLMEQGTHEELMRSNGKYAHLYNLQSNQFTTKELHV